MFRASLWSNSPPPFGAVDPSRLRLAGPSHVRDPSAQVNRLSQGWEHKLCALLSFSLLPRAPERPLFDVFVPSCCIFLVEAFVTEIAKSRRLAAVVPSIG